MLNDKMKDCELNLDDLDEVNGGTACGCTGTFTAVNTVKKTKKGDKKTTARTSEMKNSDKNKKSATYCRNDDMLKC